MVVVLGVGGARPAAPSRTPTAVAHAPAPADTHSLSQVFGSYRADDGRVFVIARLGWFFDVRNATYRTIYAGAAPTRFTIGPAFAIPLPKYADLIFDGAMLAVATAGAAVRAQSVEDKQADLTSPAARAP